VRFRKTLEDALRALRCIEINLFLVRLAPGRPVLDPRPDVAPVLSAHVTSHTPPSRSHPAQVSETMPRANPVPARRNRVQHPSRAHMAELRPRAHLSCLRRRLPISGTSMLTTAAPSAAVSGRGLLTPDLLLKYSDKTFAT
jgi:hypothetical protein